MRSSKHGITTQRSFGTGALAIRQWLYGNTGTEDMVEQWAWMRGGWWWRLDWAIAGLNLVEVFGPMTGIYDETEGWPVGSRWSWPGLRSACDGFGRFRFSQWVSDVAPVAWGGQKSISVEELVVVWWWRGRDWFLGLQVVVCSLVWRCWRRIMVAKVVYGLFEWIMFVLVGVARLQTVLDQVGSLIWFTWVVQWIGFGWWEEWVFIIWDFSLYTEESGGEKKRECLSWSNLELRVFCE